jgi:hypothetical protein
VQVIITDFLDQRRLRLSSEAPPVSGWRWMLSRGIGREHSGGMTPMPTDADDDGQQIESEPVYPGPPPPAETPAAVEEPGTAPPPEEHDTPPGTSAQVPWARRRGNASAPSQWRGMPHAKKPPAGAASPKPTDEGR